MRRTPRGGWPPPWVRMQLCFSQKRSSLNRCQTVPFSTCRMNLALHFFGSNWMTSGSHDRGDRVAARAHAAAVDLVAVVGERDGADHRAAVLGVEVQLFADRVEQHFEVFDDRVALVLIVEGVFLGAFDRVLEHVEQTPEARGLALHDQLLAAAARRASSACRPWPATGRTAAAGSCRCPFRGSASAASSGRSPGCAKGFRRKGLCDSWRP